MSRNAPSRRLAGSRSIRHRRQDSSRFRLLRHEQLEDRRLLSFVYSDFADSSEFSLLGAAAVTEDHILRVAPSTDGTGAAWQGEQQFVSLGFETTFQFRMGGKFESRNGMAFVIQNVSPTAIGGSIGGLGYSGLPNSLAIEFDTDSNWTLEDPSDSHISVHTRGVDPNSKKEFYSLGSISTSGYTLNDGNVHTAKLIYLPGQLSVFVDDMNTPQLSVPLDLASTMELNRGQAWVGFTAASLSTKGQNHDVLSWSYESPADATAVITVGDSGQRESVSGQTMMEFPVLVTRPDTSGPLTVEVLYSTTNGTATTPGDFVAVSDSLTIELADGQADATATVAVPVNADVTIEDTETFFLDLSDPVAALLANHRGRGTIFETNHDPLYPDQWGLHNSGQTGGTWDADIDAPAAWSIATGETTIVIGMIDTGVDYTDEDLYLNIWLNQGEIPETLASDLMDIDGDDLITYRDLNAPENAGYVSDLNASGYIDAGDLLADPVWADGSDTDGNGYVDDISGYDFFADVNDPRAGGATWDGGSAHGTIASKILAAIGDNGVGVAGVCWTAQIMPLRFHDGSGNGSVLDAAEAIDYAVANGATVSNNSWGAPGWPADAGYSEEVRAAIANAAAAGHIVVAAAGNDGESNDDPEYARYPASYDLDNILAVGITDADDQLAANSNFSATQVDVAAPGRITGSGTGYTSWSAPYVSGIVALLQNQHPEWSYTQVIERVLTTVDVLPSLVGKMVSGGRVNAAAALAATSIHVSDPIVVEGDSGETQMVFRISRRGDTAGTVVLDWTTLDGSAMAGTDYVATSGQVVFSDPSVTEIDIPVLVNGDADGEWAETLHLELALGSGAALIADPLALGTIVDDDTLTFPSNDVPKALKDAKNDSQWGVTTSTIDVTAEGQILDLNVLVDINHAAPNQLRASLFAPDGTQFVLFSHVGSWSGSFTDTTLDDQARMSILSGTSPFTGSYQPMDSLAALNGMSLAGKWTLEVIDRWKQDTGTLNNWALEIKTYASESNDPPHAMDDAATTDEDEAVAVDVLTNDSDLDSDPLTIDSVTQGANGNVIDNGDGTVTYTPDANFHGTDSVTYTISDGRGGTDTATVYVIIDPVADPPVAVDDLASTKRDTAVLVDVLANDLEVDNDPVSIVGFTDGANGTLSDNGDGTLTYAPGAGFTGEDIFTYTISDGDPGTADDTAIVTVTVLAPNMPPLATDDVASTDENDAAIIDVLANDTDPDGDDLTVDTISVAPQHGTAQINADGTITYTPDPNYFGSDTFTYVASDGRGGTDTANVNVTIIEVDEPETHSTGPISMEIVDAHPRQGARLTESPLVVEAGQTQITAVATLSVLVDISHGNPSQLRAYLLPPSWDEADRLTVFENPTSFLQSYPIDGLTGDALVGTWTLQLYDDFKGTVGALNEWSITVTGASTLLAKGNQGFSTPDAALLTQQDAKQAAIAALAMWAEQTHVVQPLVIDVQVTDLPAGQLGLAWGHTITLDVNASGVGWFVDQTPWDHSEFVGSNQPASNRVDLLTVVSHELGHLLGYGHETDEQNVMAASLPLGTRRLPVDMSVVRDNLSGFAVESSLLIPRLRLDVTQQDPLGDRILSSDVAGDNDLVNDMWLLPLSPADYVDLPRTSPEAVDVRQLDDITDEETELLDDDLLDLLAAGHQ